MAEHLLTEPNGENFISSEKNNSGVENYRFEQHFNKVRQNDPERKYFTAFGRMLKINYDHIQEKDTEIEAREIVMTKNNVQIEFRFKTIPLEQQLDHFTVSDLILLTTIIGKDPAKESIPEDIKIITELKLSTTVSNGGSKKEFSFSEELPQQWKCYYIPYPEFIAETLGDKVVIFGDFSKPYEVLALLHELGHVKDFEKMDKDNLQKSIEDTRQINFEENDIQPEQAERRFKLERSAWAYALSKIRPFLGKSNSGLFTVSQVREYVDNYSLGSYSRGLSERLS